MKKIIHGEFDNRIKHGKNLKVKVLESGIKELGIDGEIVTLDSYLEFGICRFHDNG